MGVTRIAAVVVVLAVVVLSVGVGLYDYRAGLITAGACFGAVGVWTLTQQE